MPVFRSWLTRLRGKMRVLFRPRSSPAISRHLARDIGLSPAELERLQFRWPSELVQHPRM